jgi:hypothetical protein
MSYHVEHLHSVQAVDDAVNREGESGRLVVVRFGRGGDDGCARLDAALAAAAERIGPVAALYAVDIDEVRGFNVMYELHGPCTLMFSTGTATSTSAASAAGTTSTGPRTTAAAGSPASSKRCTRGLRPGVY